MKKLFFLAATAMLFAACTNEEGVTPQQTATEQQGVGFDVYVPGATQNTRSGRVNVMTTNTLKKTGFGIFAYQHDNGTTTSTDDYPVYVDNTQTPDYMWNQQIFYDGSALAWYYAPLKYWPNETFNDSQTTPAGMPKQDSKTYLDRLSFFAYAPWVATDDNGTTTKPIYTDVEAVAGSGIIQLTGNDGICDSYSAGVQDPVLRYDVARDPNKSVDLLWGVAPAGGLDYTGVDGKQVHVDQGLPLKNLYKPATNTNIKFMFQHALARIGVKVVLAADQVAAGGEFDFGSTKVTVEDIAIKGTFGLNGFLNLNNDVANQAKWTIMKTAALDADALHLNSTNGLAEHLRYNWKPAEGSTPAAYYDYETAKAQQPVTGVTTTLSDAFQVNSINDTKYFKDADVATNSDFSVKVSSPVYSATTPYFKDIRDNVTPTYVEYKEGYTPTANTFYFYKNTKTGAYTEFTPNCKYPTATYWENVYKLAKANHDVIHTDYQLTAYKDKVAYRKVGDTFTPTGQRPQMGEYVFLSEPTLTKASTEFTAPANVYQAIPNYFMVIPTQLDNQKITVKIKYHVSTVDSRLAKGIVYTKNEVEKTITLPHMKNGYSYNLKLILGMTSVKVEAEVADWVTADAEVNLPQNTTE